MLKKNMNMCQTDAKFMPRLLREEKRIRSTCARTFKGGLKRIPFRDNHW
jgi:hypothetical protein